MINYCSLFAPAPLPWTPGPPRCPYILAVRPDKLFTLVWWPLNGVAVSLQMDSAMPLFGARKRTITHSVCLIILKLKMNNFSLLHSLQFWLESLDESSLFFAHTAKFTVQTQSECYNLIMELKLRPNASTRVALLESTRLCLDKVMKAKNSN